MAVAKESCSSLLPARIALEPERRLTRCLALDHTTYAIYPVLYLGCPNCAYPRFLFTGGYGQGEWVHEHLAEQRDLRMS